MMGKQNKIYGLVGFPLGHSLSPVIHNSAFNLLGIDAKYELFCLESDKLEKFFKDLQADTSPIAGLNVTVPYKEQVIKFLDSLTPFAKKTMAVNTIVISKERKLTGYNTDGPGFLAHLSELGVQTKDKKISVIGAGGAARAIASVLCLIPQRPAAIRIYDIDTCKTQALKDDLGKNMDVGIIQVVQAIDELNLTSADVLINATPIGMKQDDPALLEDTLLHPNLFVYDLVYNPSQTPLLSVAKKRGAKTSNGLGMLFYQGILAFQHWMGFELDHSIRDKIWQKLKKSKPL